MSNKMRRAFHPSYFIKEYLSELEMTQDEFAKRLGISGKQVSLLFQEKANITADIAAKLSGLIGTSIEYWLNLQAKFDAYCIYVKNEETIKEEKDVYKMIDKPFLKSIGILSDDDNGFDKSYDKVKKAATVSYLKLLKQEDLCCSFRTSSCAEIDERTIVCRNFWVSIATNLAKKKEVEKFDFNSLVAMVNDLRNLTIKKPEEFYPIIEEKLADCGVALVMLPNLKHSNINGFVKWLNPNKAMIAMNTRGATNDIFWFSFFHELKHVMQQIKRNPIIGEDGSTKDKLENEADLFAMNTLIPPGTIEKMYTPVTEKSILYMSKRINIHPGILVGRLQKEKIIPHSSFNYFKDKFTI